MGDGTGRERLERSVRRTCAGAFASRGESPARKVARVLPALDIAFNTQTLDGLGRYRLTAKLPEYLACGVPVAISPVPGFYDYVREAGWALPRGIPPAPSSPARPRRGSMDLIAATAPGRPRGPGRSPSNGSIMNA